MVSFINDVVVCAVFVSALLLGILSLEMHSVGQAVFWVARDILVQFAVMLCELVWGVVQFAVSVQYEVVANYFWVLDPLAVAQDGPVSW